jgi:hypothetical protein
LCSKGFNILGSYPKRRATAAGHGTRGAERWQVRGSGKRQRWRRGEREARACRRGFTLFSKTNGKSLMVWRRAVTTKNIILKMNLALGKTKFAWVDHPGHACGHWHCRTEV